MINGWEWTIIGFLFAVWVVYVIAYEWFVWRDTCRWFKQLPKSPIYGPAHLHRLKGPRARPNLRVVNR